MTPPARPANFLNTLLIEDSAYGPDVAVVFIEDGCTQIHVSFMVDRLRAIWREMGRDLDRLEADQAERKVAAAEAAGQESGYVIAALAEKEQER